MRLGIVASAVVAASLAKTYIGTTDHGSSAATQTFTGVAIGTPAADRLVVVIAACYTGNSGGACNGITIGGVAANIVPETNETGFRIRTVIAWLRVPTGTTADIVVSWPTSGPGGISVYNVTGQSSDTPNDADTLASATGTVLTITLTPAEGSVGVMGGAKSISSTAFDGTLWPVDADIASTPSGCRILCGSKDELTTSEMVRVNGATQIRVSAATWR